MLQALLCLKQTDRFQIRHTLQKSSGVELSGSLDIKLNATNTGVKMWIVYFKVEFINAVLVCPGSYKYLEFLVICPLKFAVSPNSGKTIHLCCLSLTHDPSLFLLLTYAHTFCLVFLTIHCKYKTVQKNSHKKELSFHLTEKKKGDKSVCSISLKLASWKSLSSGLWNSPGGWNSLHICLQHSSFYWKTLLVSKQWNQHALFHIKLSGSLYFFQKLKKDNIRCEYGLIKVEPNRSQALLASSTKWNPDERKLQPERWHSPKCFELLKSHKSCTSELTRGLIPTSSPMWSWCSRVGFLSFVP